MAGLSGSCVPCVNAMKPQSFRFGGGLSDTVLHPFIAVAMLIAVGLIVVLPRKKAIAPFLLAFFTIPFGQVLVLGGMHFFNLFVFAKMRRRALRPNQTPPVIPSSNTLPRGHALPQVH